MEVEEWGKACATPLQSLSDAPHFQLNSTVHVRKGSQMLEYELLQRHEYVPRVARHLDKFLHLMHACEDIHLGNWQE